MMHASTSKDSLQIQPRSRYLASVNTGLFMNFKKSSLLIDIVQELLSKRFGTFVEIGPKQPDNTCELILHSIRASCNFFESKAVLESYLKMVGETISNEIIDKKPEVITLDEEDEVTCIDLDDTLVNNSVEIIDLESSVCVSGNPKDETKGTDENANKSVHCNLISRVTRRKTLEQIDTDKLQRKSSTKYSSLWKNHKENISKQTDKRGAKRKYPFKNQSEEDIVEIVDLMDDSFSDSSFNMPVKVLGERREVHLASDTCKEMFSQNSSENLSSKAKNRTYSELPCSSNQCHPISNFVNSPSSEESLQTSKTVTSFKNTETPSVPPKKLSKLSYQRLPHLKQNKTSSSNNYNNNTAFLPIFSDVVPQSSTASSTSNYNKDPALDNDNPKASLSSNHNKNTASNIYNPNAGLVVKRSGLRPIVIDGNNVGVSHGKGEFSVRGIQICINYFEKRGHRKIKAFVPQYRRNKETHSLLHQMERQGTVAITPSRKVNGRIQAPYDDRYIVQYAAEFGGVIVSTDNFRDLLEENKEWKETIENRLLMFTWADDFLMFPQDPLGRNGPSLDDFLKFPD